ncbi:hypothetical protein Pmani_007068 [Petrolisthes manimaculis]|uniref:Uncharacterized protein n=1 Tax=Petrolisthes manimaculis TaxID=1843537 RepID=A0AAE1UFY6_9EUCA|nr:hypothetical protein Pmani_007068 [Petrolisthes manimaculis]
MVEGTNEVGEEKERRSEDEEKYREEFRRVVERRLGRFDREQMEEVDEVCRVFREEMCGACEEVWGEEEGERSERNSMVE